MFDREAESRGLHYQRVSVAVNPYLRRLHVGGAVIIRQPCRRGCGVVGNQQPFRSLHETIVKYNRLHVRVVEKISHLYFDRSPLSVGMQSPDTGNDASNLRTKEAREALHDKRAIVRMNQ